MFGCEVTSRPPERFSRYSKWLNTFRTALIFYTRKGGPQGGSGSFGEEKNRLPLRELSKNFLIIRPAV